MDYFIYLVFRRDTIVCHIMVSILDPPPFFTLTLTVPAAMHHILMLEINLGVLLYVC